jgi:6-phosphogluconolactonase (cycloisomerase 2 family)
MCGAIAPARLAGMSRILTAMLAAAAAGALPATAAAQPSTANFAQLTGTPGCLIAEGFVADADGEVDRPPDCAATRALLDPVRLVLPPDGGQLAVIGAGDDVSGTNGATILDRDASSGALSFASCVTDDGGDGRVGSTGACDDGDALAGADGAAFSPDGRFAYVSAAQSDAVSWFARDPKTGRLTQRGCVKRIIGIGDHCLLAGGLDGAADVLVSRDGTAVYVAAQHSGAVRVFDRDAATGALTPRSCVSGTGSDGTCTQVTGLAEVTRLAMGPGGRDLYAASSVTGALVTLGVDAATGDLHAEDCIVPDAPKSGPCHSDALLAGGVADLTVSPDGRDVIVASSAGGDYDYLPNDLLVFRHTAGGLERRQCLQQVDPQGDDAVDPEQSGPPDLSPGCQAAKALTDDSQSAVAISADGRAVFAVSNGALAAFTRDPAGGDLTQFACAETEPSYRSCTAARGIADADAVAASADARNVYVASSDGDVAVFGAAVAISSRAVVARDGRVRVRLACPAARREGCAGRLSGARYRVAAGHAAAVPVRIAARARRALRLHGRTRVSVAARDRLTIVRRTLTVRRPGLG